MNTLLFFWVLFALTMLVVLLGSLAVLHKLVMRSAENNKYASNVHALIGKQALVVSEIKLYKRGAVKIDGERWPACIESDQLIAIGAVVSVLQISGCHVVVALLHKEIEKEINTFI